MAFFAAIIYMQIMLKTIGIAAWVCCLLVLAYQAISWVLFAAWPSVTLMDALHAITNVDFLSFIESLPFDMAIKATYVCFTTQLSLFLWWAGAFSFALTFAAKIILKK